MLKAISLDRIKEELNIFNEVLFSHGSKIFRKFL